MYLLRSVIRCILAILLRKIKERREKKKKNLSKDGISSTIQTEIRLGIWKWEFLIENTGKSTMVTVTTIESKPKLA